MTLTQFYAITMRIGDLTQKIIKQEKFKEKWNNFMKDDTLGTVDEMRALLEIDYVAKNFKVNVGKPNKPILVDAMVIIPVPEIREMTMENRVTKGRNFLKKVFNHSSDLSRENLMTEVQEDEEFDDLSIENLVFMNQPNAAVYELMCYENTLVDLFLKNKSSVLLWNYRGYGRSEGTPGFCNMTSDARKVLKLVKDRLSPKKVCVYGRSLGGHVAKSLSFEVDVVILDRTFSSISKG